MSVRLNQALLQLLTLLWLSGCGRIGVEFLDPPASQRDPAQDAGAQLSDTLLDDAGVVAVEMLDAQKVDAEVADDADAPTVAVQALDVQAQDAQAVSEGGVATDAPASPCGSEGDSDGDGVCESSDVCAGGDDRLDSDSDRTPNGCDGCPNDGAKTAPGVCGCGVTPPPGLIGYWSFNASSGISAADTNGVHPGTLTNMTGNEWALGRVGNALNFDGVNDYVNVGAVANNVRALSFWIKADGFGVSSDQTGWLSPTATGAPNNQWTNPTRAYVKDGSSATTSTLTGSRAQDWSGFGIRMPSTTTGVEARLDLPGGSGLLNNTQVDFSWNAGTSYSSVCSSSSLLSLGSDTFACGNAASLWGHSPWSQAELADANFRLRIRFGGLLSSVSLDLVQVNVHYASYTEPRNIMQLSASTQLEFLGQSLRLVGFPAGSVLYVDRAQTANVDTAYHHIAIVSPTAIDVSALQIGAVAADPLPFDGSLDELKLFTQPLSATDVNTLYTSSVCL